MFKRYNRIRSGALLAQLRLHARVSPRPAVAEPDRGQEPQVRGLRSTIGDGDLDQNVFNIRFRVFHDDIEVAVVVENSGVEQFEFRLVFSAAAVFFDQSPIWELRLRVLVQILHVRVRRRAVKVKVIFLDVFAVIAFVTCQAENALFENRVTLVPQRDSKAEELSAVADASEAIFIPAVCARAGLIVREVFPCVAIRTVVFANRAPGALAKIWSPTLPVLLTRR